MNSTLIVYLTFLLSGIFIYAREGNSSSAVLLFGNLLKIISLLFAGMNLTQTENAFAPEDTPRKAWTWIAAGMWIWFIAQCIFAFYKLILNQSPYPSMADIFFVLAYVPLFIGLLIFVKDFRSTGLPMGSTNSYVIQIVVLVLIYGIIFVTLLLDLLKNDDPPLLKALNVGYPTLDFILIFMSSLLIRISFVLRGGSLARSWILLCAGFSLVAVADIMFAYGLGAWLDLLFFSAYFLISLAGVYQIRMLRQ